jgi:type II secretory pathway pseudopilin PulG
MSHCRKSAGFTFVEVLAALTFLGVLIPVVLSAMTVSLRASEIAERSSVAAGLGENMLNEMIVENTWSSAGTRGDFGQDYPGYRWQLTQASWTTGSMTELTMDVFFPVQGREQNIRLGTLASQAQTTSTQ